jgi:hypothetical protein
MSVVTACCVVCPPYGGRWPSLPRLAAAAKELAGIMADNEADVEWVVAETPEAALAAVRERAQRASRLIVYVGGHGVVDADEHFTALDLTADHPDSLDAIWTRQLALVLGRSRCEDILLILDSFFSGQALLALDQGACGRSHQPHSHRLRAGRRMPGVRDRRRRAVLGGAPGAAA